MTLKKDYIWLLGIIAAIFAFFPDLFTLQQSFLVGDHYDQQFPWALFYQEKIRHFQLPWWTTLNQCGFPLLAESQVGAFYPLNFLFLFFLPIKLAYNYQILFQYFLGASFCFWYLRRSRVSGAGAFFAVLIFLFGSTQGGYFYYNLISQKTVIWLPLTLILIDRILEEGKWRDAFFLSLVLAVQIYAGYLQVAVYSWVFAGLYFLFHWLEKRSFKAMGWFFAAGLLAIFLSLIQLLPTLELAKLSARSGAAKEIAYLYSMIPLAGLATLFYPSWDGILRSELFIGILGLFFVLLAALTPKNRKEKFFLAAAIFFILMALGKYSPIYRPLVELTGFSAFRTPIKFLFYAAFSLALLAGFGFDKLALYLQDQKEDLIRGTRRALNVFAVLTAFFFLLPPLLECFLTLGEKWLLPAFHHIIETQFYGQPGHPHALEYYLNKATAYYYDAIGTFSLREKFTLQSWVIILLAAFFTEWLVGSRRSIRIKQSACFVFLIAELYLYGFSSIQTNLEPFMVAVPEKKSVIVEYLQKDKSLYRVAEVYTDGNQNRRYPIFPHSNMRYQVADIGAYSPLVVKKYQEFFKDWVYVNDSLAFYWTDPALFLKRLPDLSKLNVKYVLSETRLLHVSLREVMREGSVILYENSDVYPRAFFVPDPELKKLADIRDPVPAKIISYQDTRIELEVDSQMAGTLFVSDLSYPSWKAFVDNQPVTVQAPEGLFRAISLAPGKRQIVMKYDPVLYKTLVWINLGLVLLLSAALLYQSGRSRLACEKSL